MSDDNVRQEAATNSDEVRQPATNSDNEFTLAISDVVALYEKAGHPRTPRSIQRYCVKGHLDYRLLEASFGEKFLITTASVARHISYINEVRQAATVVAENNGNEEQEVAATRSEDVRQATTENKVSQPVATDQRVIELLERENEFLRDQVKMKDKQIAEQSERSRETNVLINGLQRMLTPLLGDPNRAPRHPSPEENF